MTNQTTEKSISFKLNLDSLNSNTPFVVCEKKVTGHIHLTAGKVTLLLGENGVGKTSFFNFLKKTVLSAYPKGYLSFTDQTRLTPLNDVSFLNILHVLRPFKFSELKVYDELFESTKSFHSIPINNLSGGQNQMIKILITSYLGGSIFFFDEPLQYLDRENKKLFVKLLSSLRELNCAICIIEHNPDCILELIDQQIILVESGSKICLKDISND